jgi:hypothetical protein
MPATVTQVMDGLKTSLGAISGLRSFSYQPDQLNPPMAFPVLNSVSYHRAFNGGDVVFNCSIFVIVGRYTDRTADALLDLYLSYSGASSIRAAIEADKTLGGICQTLIVNSSAEVTSLNSADAEFLEIQFKVEVHG